ncbi:MAG: reverse transcriptase domain-containing protein [Pseudomonadota bacterium]|nr:reverse transcriptase domain-containing protein [Pseudomonadota bacterium]
MLDQILDEHGVPPDGWAFDRPPLTGALLRRQAAAMTGRAAGEDGWRAEHMLLMPEGYWATLAEIWEGFLNGAPMPAALNQVRTVNIPKEEGGLRPVSIAQLLWRIANSALLAQVAPWVEAWAPEALQGGLKGRSAEHIHAQLMEALDRARREGHPFSAVKQDLRKCFDSVRPEVAVHLLRRFGLPEALGRYILRFYEGQNRWMQAAGATAAAPLKPEISILQGCPLSCLLLAALMATWVRAVANAAPEVQAGIYVDDRFLSTDSEEPEGPLEQAVIAGAAADLALGFLRHPDKKRAAATNRPLRLRLRPLADRVGRAKDSLEVLGVHYAFGLRRVRTYKVVRREEADRRLRRVACVSRAAGMRRKLIRQLVLPMLA